MNPEIRGTYYRAKREKPQLSSQIYKKSNQNHPAFKKRKGR